LLFLVLWWVYLQICIDIENLLLGEM